MSYPEDEQWRPERRDAASQLPEKVRAVACKSLAREPVGLYQLFCGERSVPGYTDFDL